MTCFMFYWSVQTQAVLEVLGKKITFLFFFQSLLKRFVPQEYLPSTESISVEASVNSRGLEGPGPGLCWV